MNRILLNVLVTSILTLPLISSASTFYDVGTFDDEGSLFGPPFGVAYNLSEDGSVVLGNDNFGDSWTWNASTEFELIPKPPESNHRLFPMDISADGNVVVGYSDKESYVWNRQEQQFFPLELPTAATSSRAVWVSNDATVVGGTITLDEQPYVVRWGKDRVEVLDAVPDLVRNMSERGDVAVLNGGYVWTESLGVEQIGMVGNDLSNDGSVAVGYVRAQNDNLQAARWIHDAGVSKLGFLPGFTRSEAHAVSSDGVVTIGWSDMKDDGSHEARTFVWDPIGGMRDLELVLREEFGLHDIELSSWGRPGHLIRSLFISDDMRTIAGARKLEPNSAGAAAPQNVWAVHLDRPLVVSSGVSGDFDNDAQLDAEDIDLMSAELRAQRSVSLFDVNGDGSVNSSDHAFWVHDLANTYIGDTDLDGEFNTTDLVNVFKAGEYEDDVEGNSGWAEGDWNADGDFTTSDLTAAFQDGGFEMGPRAAIVVPEPSGAFLMFAALVSTSLVIKRRIFSR